MIEIQQIDNGEKGYFKAVEGEKQAGKMTYTWAAADRIIIDHTEVNSEFRGQDVGKKMVYAAVEFAREKGISIIPLCPFAKSVFAKTPEIRDVL